MNTVIFLILRQLRWPLLSIVVVYAITMLGLTLIPGRNPDGSLWYMSFFDAFYFVSFMATTIGFGEIPQEFSPAQRLWVTFALYVTVIAWLYGIGKVLALLQNSAFKQALTEKRFANRIKQFREQFFLVCGYGETGSALVRSLVERGQHVVILEIDPERVDLVDIHDLPDYVPALCADAASTRHLRMAGLDHRSCGGVVALTNINEVNLKIAITAKLLNTGVRVICRADSLDVEANMASFGTDHIIDPFDTFAMQLAIALEAPCLYLLERWLTGHGARDYCEPVYPPKDGPWIICGYGRFGKAIRNRLRKDGIRTVVIEAIPSQTGQPPEGCVVGRGTEAETLLQAGVEEAVGLVAGTDDDTNNLSIVMTARELNPRLFIVVRQNQHENVDIVSAVYAEMVMQPANIIAGKVRMLLGTPLLYDFLALARMQDESWTCQLVSRLSGFVNPERGPKVAELVIDEQRAPALYHHLHGGGSASLGDITCGPKPGPASGGRGCLVLLIERLDRRLLLPADDTHVQIGDRILFSGDQGAFRELERLLQFHAVLHHRLVGEYRPDGWAWRLVRRLMSRSG